jgi:hypothetical protein
MSVFYLKIESLLSLFAGVFVSMLFCALIAVHGPGKLTRPQTVQAEPDDESAPPVFPAGFSLGEAILSSPAEQGDNRILDFYRDPDSRDWVVSFFTSLCGSRYIAAVILTNAAAFDVAPALAFALSWEESRYNPRAVNRKNRDESIDRGLFQLNSRSFPKITEQDFFNPSINAWYGMGHLRWCLDSGGSEIAALAMYNAGTGRVRSLGAPKITLDYIHRILENRRKIEEAFQAELRRRVELNLAVNPKTPGEGFEPLPAEAEELAELASAKQSWPRFLRLAPLLGNR